MRGARSSSASTSARAASRRSSSRRAGDVVAAATTPLTLSTPQPGWAEQDPEAWWEATLASIARGAARSAPTRGSPRSGSRGRCTRRCSSTARATVDPAGAALVRRAHDGGVRGDHASASGGEERLRDWVAIPALEGFTLPKVLWLRNHEPEAFARLATVLLAEGLHPLPPHGSARDRAVRRVGDADVRHGAPALERRDPARRSSVPTRAAARRRRLVGGARPRRRRGGGARPGSRRARRSSAAARTTRAAPPASASSRRARRWRAGGRRARCSRRPRSRCVDPRLRAHTFCHVVPGIWYLMGVVLSAGGAFAWYRDQLARELAGTRDADAQARRRGGRGAAPARRA